MSFTEIRKNIFLAAYAAGAGHLASAFSLVEILQTLYLDGVMRHDPKNPLWEHRDLLILSKGHGSLALYVILAECGYFPEEKLWQFCRPGTILGGEPNVLECPGVEASTGSLGHGLSVGVGMALALKKDKRQNHVYVIAGDGECQEGSIWEAAISAPAFALDNLTLIIDDNHIQKMDFTDRIIGPDTLPEKFAAFGWEVSCCDGHDRGRLKDVLSEPSVSGKPRCVVANTIKGKGVPLMENNPAWHWRMPSRKEQKVFKAALNITDEELEEVKRRAEDAESLY